MPSAEVRYHKSTENIDDTESGVKVRPLDAKYCRFSTLERILIITVCLLCLLAVVFATLYAVEASEGTTKSNGAEGTQNVCLTADCVKTSADIMNSLEWSIDPCDDFYEFVCSKWSASHQIPDTASDLNQFSALEQKNDQFMREKLERKETLKEYSKNEAVAKAIKDYISCMEAENVKDSVKMARAHALIKQYGSWNITDRQWRQSGWNLMANLVNIHRDHLILGTPLFMIRVVDDIKNSSKHILTIREAYKDMMLTVITILANSTKDDPDIVRQVEGIYDFEHRLAEISMSLADAKKTEKNYRKITLKELQDYTHHNFNWLGFFQRLFQGIDADINNETTVNAAHLDYLRNMTAIVERTDDVVLGNYLIWKVISETYPYLSKAIKDAFQEYGRKTSGVLREPPRWQSCLRSTKATLGLPLSMLYVDEKFGEDKLKHVEEMIQGIRKKYVASIENIKWMDEETKRAALKKARSIKQNIGYPKILLEQHELNKQYEELKIDEKDYFGNLLRKQKFTRKENLKRLQKPVDKNDWSMSPYRANAYYKPTENKIVFPAGVLQAPFFDTSRPKAINYGAIGVVIGHELTHSFDNRGRRYDEHGNYADWWKKTSVTEFKKRTQCLVKKYSKYMFYEFRVNGTNTLDENIADNGGVRQAFQAYQEWTEMNGNEPGLPALNLTNDQLFFVGFGQTWCAKYRASVRRYAVTGSHSPEMFRIIGTVSNFPEFSKAFNCPAGSRMNAREKCFVW